MKCATTMFVSAPIYRFTIHNCCFVFQFQSQLWGIPVCFQLRCEQTGCVRNVKEENR